MLGGVSRLRPELVGPGLIAEMACGAAQHDDFERSVLELLDRQIGADVSFFSRPGGVSPVAFGLDPRVLPRARRRFARMGAEVSRLLPEASRQGGVAVDSECFGAELPRLVYYDTFMRPHHGRTTLLGFLIYQGRCVSRVVLGRSQGSPDFHARDKARLRELLPTLTLAQHGYLLAAQVASSALTRSSDPGSAPPTSLIRLSPREREVCSYLELGYTNDQIALALGTAARTVRNQLSRVYEKLGVSSRAEAVAVWHGTNVPWSRNGR
jgi:DNA-binding CsgD family transcriptional regulator